MPPILLKKLKVFQKNLFVKLFFVKVLILDTKEKYLLIIKVYLLKKICAIWNPGPVTKTFLNQSFSSLISILLKSKNNAPKNDSNKTWRKYTEKKTTKNGFPCTRKSNKPFFLRKK